MKRLSLHELLANGVTLANNAQAIKGGNLDKCHPEREGGGAIPAQY